VLYQCGRSRQNVSVVAALVIPAMRDRAWCYFRLAPDASIDGRGVRAQRRQIHAELLPPYRALDHGAAIPARQRVSPSALAQTGAHHQTHILPGVCGLGCLPATLPAFQLSSGQTLNLSESLSCHDSS
jgi:hypothetical protein